MQTERTFKRRHKPEISTGPLLTKKPAIAGLFVYVVSMG